LAVTDRAQEITFAEVREMSVRGILYPAESLRKREWGLKVLKPELALLAVEVLEMQ
jgi:hypothetical protein